MMHAIRCPQCGDYCLIQEVNRELIFVCDHDGVFQMFIGEGDARQPATWSDLEDNETK